MNYSTTEAMAKAAAQKAAENRDLVSTLTEAQRIATQTPMFNPPKNGNTSDGATPERLNRENGGRK